MARPDFIFIGGVHRSGTDLIRNVLNAADEIRICGETHFLGSPGIVSLLRQTLVNSTVPLDREWLAGRKATAGSRQLLKRVGDLCTDDGARRIVDYLYTGVFHSERAFWRRFAEHVPRDEFLRRVLATDRSDRAFFELLMTLYAGDRPIRGEKTPAHIHFVPLLIEWFPGARFVHMLRDPRAVFLSQKTKKARSRYVSSAHRLFRRSPLVYELYMSASVIIHWLRVVQLHHHYQRCYPDQYNLLRFEDMVTDPSTHLKKVCDFLGVELTDRMLIQPIVNSSFVPSKTAQGFDASVAERWRRHLHPGTNRWFVTICRPYLLEFGYPL